MITVTQFKSLLTNNSGGKPISKIQDFYSLLYQAMIMVKSMVDLPSSIRTTQLINPIYSNVDYYVVPADLDMGGLISLYPIKPDDSYYDYQNFSQRQFGIENKFISSSTVGSSFVKRYAIKYKDGVPYILISGTGTVPVVINNCESLTANGTFSAQGVASAVAADSQQVYAGTASISFTVNAGGAQGLINSSMTSVDLSAQKVILFAAYLPTLTGFTGVRIGLGQSAGAYYTANATTDFWGNTLTTGWNLIAINTSSFTTGAGSPSWTGVVYMTYEVLGTFSTSTTGFRLDNLVANVGVLAQIDYYSGYSFASSSMSFKEMPTADGDYIVMNGSELPLLINQFIELMATDIKQKGAGADVAVFGGAKLKGMYDQFKIDFPSMRQLMITQYSNRPNFDIEYPNSSSSGALP